MILPPDTRTTITFAYAQVRPVPSAGNELLSITVQKFEQRTRIDPRNVISPRCTANTDIKGPTKTRTGVSANVEYAARERVVGGYGELEQITTLKLEPTNRLTIIDRPGSNPARVSSQPTSFSEQRLVRVSHIQRSFADDGHIPKWLAW